MQKRPRAFVAIDVEDWRDFGPTSDAIQKLDVYEDSRVAKRAIGFIWPEDNRKLVVVEK